MPKCIPSNKTRLGGYIATVLLIISIISALFTLLGCLALIDKAPIFSLIVSGCIFIYSGILVASFLYKPSNRTANYSCHERNKYGNFGAIRVAIERIKKLCCNLKIFCGQTSIQQCHQAKQKDQTAHDGDSYKDTTNNLTYKTPHNTSPEDSL